MTKNNRNDAFCILHFALCISHFALCISHFVLCIFIK